MNEFFYAWFITESIGEKLEIGFVFYHYIKRLLEHY